MVVNPRMKRERMSHRPAMMFRPLAVETYCK
jgi:hypothetical protein